MPWTRAARAELAANLDLAAVNDSAAAASGRAVAADPAAEPAGREQAAACARTLSGRAADLRAQATAIRDGADPAELGH
ncbi:hypothetical protein ACFVVA_41880 [Kitasatospora sp. NPDC058048]|uniref:hypothetical protein n=1 Tax=Kitasatospora sp. NPDC058048 TaxID=3346313 RepID=UPI0036DF5FA1